MTRNVFAGKAVIAELRGTGTGIGDMVTWKTSDPASGTEVSYRNDGTANAGYVSGQVEPLGQSVALTDPEPPNEPSTYAQHLFFASEPEWQCKVPDAFYGGFQGRPDHCQNRLVYIDHAETLFSPLSLGKMAVPTLVDSPLSPVGSGPRTTYASNAMRYALRSSDKEKQTKSCPEGTTPTPDANGDIQCVGTGVTEVQVSGNLWIDLFVDEGRLVKGLAGFASSRKGEQELQVLKNTGIDQDKDDCRRNVLDKLATIGFKLSEFYDYLKKGVDLVDAATSPILAYVALGRNFERPLYLSNSTTTAGHALLLQRDVDAMTSLSLSMTKLTVFIVPGKAKSSVGFLFHEALHGFGAFLNRGNKVDSGAKLLGPYSDEKLKSLFGITTPGTRGISQYIDDHCGDYFQKQ